MIDREQVPPHVRTLIDELVNGTISNERLATLEDALRGNAIAQTYFLDYCQLHVDLAVDARAEHALEAFCQLRGRSTKENGTKTNDEKPPKATDVPLPPAALPPAPQKTFTSIMLQLGQHLPGPGAMGGILGGLALVVALFVLRSNENSAPEAPDADQAQQVAAAPPTAYISGTKLRVDTGESHIALSEGVSVIIRGPAELELLGPLRARLSRGRIKVRVTDSKAEGFVVETPSGRVVDLGTEFGLDVSADGDTKVVVYQGAVDLHVGQQTDKVGATGNAENRVERLVEGEGVVVNQRGQLHRVMSIITGGEGAFGQPDFANMAGEPTILDVRDNLRTSETKKFYEIVTHGMQEDALAYVDRRQHDWNGVTTAGMPGYLVGADYIKTYNNDRVRKDFALQVSLARPARLFVFFDKRLPIPDWLKNDFRDTGDAIGLDCGPFVSPINNRRQRGRREKGPGNFDDTLAIWERVVPAAGNVTLGSAEATTYHATTMYGIAAVPLQ